MSFQNTLDKELARRNLKMPDQAPKQVWNHSDKAVNFSFRYFLFGLILASVVTATFSVYAAMNADATKKNLQNRLSSKAVLVERETVLPTMTVQPVVTMMPTDVLPNAQEEINPQTSQPEQSNTGTVITDAIPGLFESTALGIKPIRRERDGMTVFEAYKKPVDLTNKPKLAFIINNLGLSSSRTNTIINDFDENITLSFSPYASDINGLVKSARQNGHEVWLNIPLQSKNFPLDDPGPLTLLKEVSTVQNKDRLDRLLTLTSGYVGLIPEPDHAYNAQSVRTSPVMNEILTRGLAVFESRTGRNNFIKELAIKNDAAFGKADFWLNPEKSLPLLTKDLEQVVEFAKARGSATVMLSPYPSSLDALKAFLGKYQNDIQLIPASALTSYD